MKKLIIILLFVPFLLKSQVTMDYKIGKRHIVVLDFENERQAKRIQKRFKKAGKEKFCQFYNEKLYMVLKNEDIVLKYKGLFRMKYCIPKRLMVKTKQVEIQKITI